MNLATDLMGIKKNGMALENRAFARDVLSIEIEGPSRPQLMLVDIPGLIETATKGVTDADIDLVTEITDHYIRQPRTICLTVISSTSDYATQRILTKVREVDPEGDRTLGVITKPDRLPAGSGSERAFIELAKNNDIFFKLGWHVLKNRTFEEAGCTFEHRNHSEAKYFRESNFNELGQDTLGVDALRSRLSALLFEHIKRELPKLRSDLNIALADTEKQLQILGNPRSSLTECRTYLTNLSLDFYELCKAGISGTYERKFFEYNNKQSFGDKSSGAARRLRAMIQFLNQDFNEHMRTKGHKFKIVDDAADSTSKPALAIMPESDQDDGDDAAADPVLERATMPQPDQDKYDDARQPIVLEKWEALNWVRSVMVRTRGREVMGTFNPLLIGELFWEQSTKRQPTAEDHVGTVARSCRQFLDALLMEHCPKDVKTRLWSSHLEVAFNQRLKAALQELQRLIQDQKDYPINYNHYFTDTVNALRKYTLESSLKESVEAATTHKHLVGCHSTHTSASIDISKAVQSLMPKMDHNMENVSCGEALDHALALYKVSLDETSILY